MSGLIWIKLSCELFSNRKISKIRKMKNGDELALIWVFLLLLAARLNKGGKLSFKKGEGYSASDIAEEGGFKPERVRDAVSVFLELDMLRDCGGIYKIKNWQKYQKNEQYAKEKEQNRKRVSEFRKRHKQRKAPLPITDEEMEKLKLQINKENLEHYLEVIGRGIGDGREYESAYRAIVAMATKDKRRKVDEKVSLNLRNQYQDERLLLPDEELSYCDIAFKNALRRSYGSCGEADENGAEIRDTGGD